MRMTSNSVAAANNEGHKDTRLFSRPIPSTTEYIRPTRSLRYWPPNKDVRGRSHDTSTTTIYVSGRHVASAFKGKDKTVGNILEERNSMTILPALRRPSL